MRAILKSAAYAVAPDTALKLLSIRSRRMIERQARDLGLADLTRRIAERTGGQVASGPFAGMRLDHDLLPVHNAPKYLGTYEQELHDHVERAIGLNPPTVLNVGCAEGYYAVGFAMRLPSARVFVADADPKAERAALGNAKLNGVTVRAVGIVHPGEFGLYLAPDSLLFMDCEGAEFTLLDPRNDPILNGAVIIVEVHPSAGTAQTLIDRFPGHSVKHIHPTSRSEPEADERAGPRSWLVMTPALAA